MWVKRYSLSLLAIIVVIVGNGHQAEAVCGYKGCPATKSNMINVHLVPHTHDDVGWLKTVDQYYYGSRNGIQHAGVQYILDNVIAELNKDKNRRFIYVESAFFFKWFDAQSADVKKNVKKLVDNGQLEFAGGAWSMNDEADVHYQSVIDHFTLGLKKLNDVLGACARPRIGWQIDPFGHSREMASIFAQMGYDGEFFARLDWVEKNARLKNQTAEMVWKASADLGESAEIFTGVLYNHYSAPPGFCFDALCTDDPIIDGDSYDNNVKNRVDTFISYINNVTATYRTNHVLVPMGDDFNYENAAMNFINMDKLIKYVNERQIQGSKINVFYSTPGCYLNSVHNLLQTWPNKTEDFFPYSTDWHTYWTGYYTSRPTQKRFEREGNHFMQVTKQLTTLANLTGTDVTNNLDKLRDVMGIFQHHDAITGTERQLVAYDYDRLMADALQSSQNNARMALQKLTNLTNGEFLSCLQLNISVCDFTRTSANNVVVTLFNPLAHVSSQFVRIPVKNEGYIVKDANGRIVPSQLVPIPADVANLSYRPKDTSYELVFAAVVEKISNYYIQTTKLMDDATSEIDGHHHNRLPKRFQHQSESYAFEGSAAQSNEVEVAPRADVIVQNSNVKLTIDSTGHLTKVEMNGVSENVRQEFYYYKGAAGNNAEFKNRSSGAYIFRPNGTEVLMSKSIQFTVYEGPLVKEVHQRINDWCSQVIRIYEGERRVQFEWMVGPIPIEDGIGKEVIMHFTTSIKNDGVFYTDSNGREMIRRVRNKREYFTPNMTEHISGNYYPVTARIAMEDKQKRIALLNDRAQGGSSIRDGQLELMLHRRLLRDDAFGVSQALNETAYGKGLVARGKIDLVLNAINNRPTIDERILQQEIHLPFWKFFSSASRATNKVPPKLASFAGLPLSVQVLTLEPFSNNERLLRLENFMDKSETSTANFNIRAIFDALGGEEIRETTLDGSMALKDMKRFKFALDGTKPTKVEYYTSKHTPLTATKKDPQSKFSISLDPMQIRTFIVKWK